MNSITQIDQLRTYLQDFRRHSKTIALVPTMGFLHDGHLSLIRKAKSENDIVVVSIFVNPTQFAPHEDFARYPRDFDRDSALAAGAGCDCIFYPSVDEMYPDGFSTYVSVDVLSTVLEGKFRPTHFKGVTTVVSKLFNIVQPARAYFGQKDAQQCIIVKKMTADLVMPVEIVIVPTMREKDGLAMSSRNIYLSPEERKKATVLYESLQLAEREINRGERNVSAILSQMNALIEAKHPAAVDYIDIVDAATLQSKTILSHGDEVLIPVAVRFGTTRLIDNTIIQIA